MFPITLLDSSCSIFLHLLDFNQSVIHHIKIVFKYDDALCVFGIPDSISFETFMTTESWSVEEMARLVGF